MIPGRWSYVRAYPSNEDKGYGCCWLKIPEIAAIVEDNLLNFDGTRYRLLAWCVMPNHVHVMVDIEPGITLGEVCHSWRSYTAKKINKLLGRTGVVWNVLGMIASSEMMLTTITCSGISKIIL